MPIFAVGHAYAFAYQNFTNPPQRFAGRLPVPFAVRDSFSIADIVADIILTFRGTDYTYQAFEPNDSVVHHEFARESRSRAGLRYAEQGKNKYWIPRSPTEQNRSLEGQRNQHLRPIVSEDSSLLGQLPSKSYFSVQPSDERRNNVRFPSPDYEEDCLYDIARSLPYGDYKYPCIESTRTTSPSPDP
ncbi:hypothetical protein MYAM1_000318 [Malassezia yamatoensis]|uniref:Uncharacterized protein n=1 Tax=Malassezia yamatoensis TaxID=253288 RepID=A0AAJ6CGF3_9BASI|nr:hypothetical protein MYAM1_000318 [Malassezia yamatoensis]